jgi:hypothetical protein
MPEPDSSIQRQIRVDAQPPEEVSVPERDLESITSTFEEAQEGDSVALTVGYDETIQDIELIVDEIHRDGGRLNEEWDTEIALISKVVTPEEAAPSNDNYLQVFVTGVPQQDDLPPWFVYSYRIKKSTGEEVAFVDPDTGAEYPSCFAHGWVVDVKNFFGGEVR